MYQTTKFYPLRPLLTPLQHCSQSTSFSKTAGTTLSTRKNEKTRQEKSQEIAHGPGFEDFIAGVVPRSSAEGYSGSLKLSDSSQSRLRLPPWLKTQIPSGKNYAKLKSDLRGLGLATVCEEARCPNIGECW